MQYESLIREVQGGGEEALERLWYRVEHFAITIARRYSATASVDTDDLMQCAFLGVRAAAYSYDGRYRILSLIAWMIRNECRRALSLDRKREPDFVSYDAPMDSLVNTLSSDVGDLKKMVSFTTFTEIGGGMLEGAKNIYEGARQISEGTREYRREMSFLELNAANAGLDTGKIKEKAFEIASITGNLDGAVEGLNSLISSRLDMDELTLATDRLIGAALELPGVLTFEELAEGFQESVVSGTPTGQYMELLERMAQEYGNVEKYVEDINKSFKNAPDLEARQTVGLAWLSEHGFEQNKKTWEENNKEIKEATDAQNKLNDAWAETGEIIEPVMTKIDQLSAMVLDEANSFLKDEETPLTKAAEEAGKKAGRWVNGILNSEDSKELEQNAHLYWQQQKNIVVDQMKSVFGEEENEDMSAWMNFQKLLMRDEDTGALGKKASEEFLKGMHDYILENTPAVERDSKAAGKGIGSGLGDGVLGQTPYAVSQVRNMMALMQAEVNKGIVMPTIPVSIKRNTSSGSPVAEGSDLNVNVNMSMDGKTLSKAQGEYISDEIGSRVDRIEKYT